jgi:hypothetical protein
LRQEELTARVPFSHHRHGRDKALQHDILGVDTLGERALDRFGQLGAFAANAFVLDKV